MLIYRASKKSFQKLNDNLRSVAGRQTERRFCVGVLSFFWVSGRDSKKNKNTNEKKKEA
jgi:hypothetical protein